MNAGTREARVFRRCGCRAADGRQYGILPEIPTEQQRVKACPKMSDAGHGYWTYRVTDGFRFVDGRRVRNVINGKAHKTAKLAKVALRRDLVAKDEKRLQRPARETLATYAPGWLERRQTTGERPLKPSTASMYRRYLDGDIIPSRLGHTKLSELRRSDVVAFVDDLRQAGRGATTIRRILAVVQGALTSAVKDELIPVNVAHRVEAPTIARTERAVWEPSHLAHFLAVAGAHRLGALYELTLYAALRRGEVAGLRWQDVDLTRGLVTIRNNRVRASDGVIHEQSTKTATSEATIALSTEAVIALQGWKLRQSLERKDAAEAWQNTGYVFTMEDGRPLDPMYVSWLFHRLRRETEIGMQAEQLAPIVEHLRREREHLDEAAAEAEARQLLDVCLVSLPATSLHGLRHTAATYMWEAGADIAQVSKALRHSSVGVTSTVYAHMREGALREVFGGVGKRLADGLKADLAHTSHTQRP